MRLFISAGEPSGDMHGANLIRALRQLDPSVEVAGFGGDQMRSTGCELLFPLCDLAVVGVVKILGSLPQFAAILDIGDRYLRKHRPDALVMIDYPGFHWWLAKAARARNSRHLFRPATDLGLGQLAPSQDAATRR